MTPNQDVETWVDIPVIQTGVLIDEAPSYIEGIKKVLHHYNNMPLKQLPLFINHEDISIRAICQERLSGREILDISVNWSYSPISPRVCYLYCKVRVT